MAQLMRKGDQYLTKVVIFESDDEKSEISHENEKPFYGPHETYSQPERTRGGSHERDRILDARVE